MRQEAQAVVLAAGPGMRMTTLTNHTPKCLLPIGTLPMLCYPLHMLQEAGFSEVTVVVSAGQEQRVRKVVEQYGLKLNLDIAAVNTSHDPGTADSLRHASKIKREVDEVVVVTSDLVSDVQLQVVMDQHRARGAALTMLTAPLQAEYARAVPPGPKTKPSLNNDLICTEAGSGRLMFAVAGGDYDDSVGHPSRVLRATKAALGLSSTTLDAHLYIMKRWLLDYALSKESGCKEMGSLKAEIIPHLISCQFKEPTIKDPKLDIQEAVEHEEYEELVSRYNTSTVLSRHHSSRALDHRVCYVHHHTGLCVRANTLSTYWLLNRKMHSVFDQVYRNSEWSLKHESADVHEKAQVSEDSLVGSGSVVCEKTNVSSSVVGNHCRVNPLVRLLHTVLADHITIASGCVIENSLICASVEKKCTIKNCILTDPNKIEEGRTYTNEILEASQDFT